MDQIIEILVSAGVLIVALLILLSMVIVVMWILYAIVSNQKTLKVMDEKWPS